jgi:hypothetical protein
VSDPNSDALPLGYTPYNILYNLYNINTTNNFKY